MHAVPTKDITTVPWRSLSLSFPGPEMSNVLSYIASPCNQCHSFCLFKWHITNVLVKTTIQIHASAIFYACRWSSYLAPKLMISWNFHIPEFYFHSHSSAHSQAQLMAAAPLSFKNTLAKNNTFTLLHFKQICCAWCTKWVAGFLKTRHYCSCTSNCHFLEWFRLAAPQLTSEVPDSLLSHKHKFTTT